MQIELNAPNLTTLVDTNNNTDNDHGAFNGSGITSIKNLGTIHTIPIGYPQSDRGQFGNCPNLVHVNLPATLTYIGEYSFYNCPNLTSVICLPTTPPVLDGTNVFTNANALLKIYVPDDSVNAYKSATNWSTYASRIYSMTQFDIDHPKTRA